MDPLTARDLAGADLLLLADGHCLADQVRSVCGSEAASRSQEASDLRASSLETLLHLVSAGFGATLLPALAVRRPWTTELAVTARPLDIPEARRTIRLAYRRSFPRTRAIEALAQVVVEHLPDTVTPRYSVSGGSG